jgi:hypothetical protein
MGKKKERVYEHLEFARLLTFYVVPERERSADLTTKDTEVTEKAQNKNGRECGRYLEKRKTSIQPETHFDVDLHSYRFPILHGGFKLPLLHSFNRFFIEAKTERSGNLDVARLAIGAHDQP